jgi:putative DNA primase/helicase
MSELYRIGDSNLIFRLWTGPRTPTELRLKLAAVGFSPIPITGKAPKLTRWQTKVGASAKEIRSWGRGYFSTHTNTGILCKQTPFLDVDIRVEAAAAAVEQLVRDRYGEHGKFMVRTGRAPKRGVPFHTTAPFGKIEIRLLPPGFVPRPGDQGDKLEFLARGQQFVAFGVHPDTKRPYSWAGGRPDEIENVKELPHVTEAEARQLMEDAAELLCAEHGYTRAGGQQWWRRRAAAGRRRDWQRCGRAARER